MGCDENEMLGQFSKDLRIDLLKSLYKKPIEQSDMFNITNDSQYMQLLRSFLQFMKIKIFMPNNLMIIAGSVYSDIYLILEGSAYIFNLNAQFCGELTPGNFFGAVFGKNTRQ